MMQKITRNQVQLLKEKKPVSKLLEKQRKGIYKKLEKMQVFSENLPKMKFSNFHEKKEENHEKETKNT